MPKGKPPPPLELTKGEHVVGTWHYTRHLDVSLDYVKCLIQNKELSLKSATCIEHKQPVNAYVRQLNILQGNLELALGDLQDEHAMIEDVVMPPLPPLATGRKATLIPMMSVSLELVAATMLKIMFQLLDSMRVSSLHPTWTQILHL